MPNTINDIKEFLDRLLFCSFSFTLFYVILFIYFILFYLSIRFDWLVVTLNVFIKVLKIKDDQDFLREFFYHRLINWTIWKKKEFLKEQKNSLITYALHFSN